MINTLEYNYFMRLNNPNNFRFLACLEVTEKFVCGGGLVGGGFQVATVSYLNDVAFELL